MLCQVNCALITDMRAVLSKYGDEVIVPGPESELRLEGDADGVDAKISRGWRIKVKESSDQISSHASFWLRIYEDISPSTCYQCSCLGWGKEPHGLTTCSKYHFVVVTSPGENPNSKQGMGLVVSLHGVVHSNGAGHLMHINGKEAGGMHSGTRMMDVWDGICCALGACVVSVQDMSSKYIPGAKASMYLRLTHAVAYGKTWYGHWGYNVARGSYGKTTEDYMQARDRLREVQLSDVLDDLSGYSNRKVSSCARTA